MGEDINFSYGEDFKMTETVEEEEEPYKIGIFWDVGACPFPEEMDPDLIYQKIESALIERGAKGEMSIFAYVDDTKACWLRKKKTWKARLEFIPQGAKPSLRMLNDVLLWRTVYLAPSTLILVSDKVSGSDILYRRLKGLVIRHYGVYLVEPTGGCVESPEWPGSLFDYPNPRTIKWQDPEKCIPAKRKAVGEGSSEDEG